MKNYLKKYIKYLLEVRQRLICIEDKENELLKIARKLSTADRGKRGDEDIPAMLKKRKQYFLGAEAYPDYYDLKRAFTVKKIKNANKVRLGRPNDGGYVCVDEAIKKGGTAYSFGISDDVSWDRDLAEKYGCEIYQYDHTVNGLPEQNCKFHFTRSGISAKDEPGKHTMSLPSLLKANGHENTDGLVLKMDVEGAEWDILDALPQKVLLQFSMIVMEMHDFHLERKISKYVSILDKINQTHQLVHLHPNNCGDIWHCGDIAFTHAVEVTYVRKDLFTFEDGLFIVPQPIDQPCNPYLEEALLGNFGKKNGENG